MWGTVHPLSFNWFACYVWMEGNKRGVDKREWGRFKEPYLGFYFILFIIIFFKWEGEGFEGIRDKIPLQTPIINSPELAEFGGRVKETSSTHILKN